MGGGAGNGPSSLPPSSRNPAPVGVTKAGLHAFGKPATVDFQS